MLVCVCVLFMAEDVTVTTRGDVLSLDGQEGILDTLHVCVCVRACVRVCVCIYVCVHR